jgi:NADPH-dependent glutamate synthase beta subunit-like oxidoreductase
MAVEARFAPGRQDRRLPAIRKEMPAIREEIEEAEREGIEFLFRRQPVAFHADGSAPSVELAEVEMGEPDDTGRRRPIVSNRTARLACDRVLLALGQSADTSLLPEGCEIVDGRVRTTAGETNIFVAGDFATGDGTVAHAIGDGRRAAGRVLVALGEEAQSCPARPLPFRSPRSAWIISPPPRPWRSRRP